MKLSDVCVYSVVFLREIKLHLGSSAGTASECSKTQQNNMYQVNCKCPEIVSRECKTESKTLFFRAIPRNESAKTIPKNFQLLTKI